MGEELWTTEKPNQAGVYGVRGFNLGLPKEMQFEAVVQVKRDEGGNLVCNLHSVTSEDDLEGWDLVSKFNSKFEWLKYPHPDEHAELIDLLQRAAKDLEFWKMGLAKEIADHLGIF